MTNNLSFANQSAVDRGVPYSEVSTKTNQVRAEAPELLSLATPVLWWAKFHLTQMLLSK